MSSDPSNQWLITDPQSQRPYLHGQAYEQARPFSGPMPQDGFTGPGQGDRRTAANPEPSPYAQPDQYGQPYPYAQVQPYGQPQAGYAVRPIVAPKNPAIGVLLSFFIPGLGSMVNGSAGRGVLILVLYIVGWVLSFFLIGIPILIGAWIWALVDGYTSAQRWNSQHGIIS
jgi:TM2 domain-containing membrane protein YozV